MSRRVGISFYSEIEKAIKYIEKGEFNARKRAAQHLRRKMRQKVSSKTKSAPGNPPGRGTGNLRKGIIYINGKQKTKVGVGPPAYHAHILEFGSEERYVKTSNKKKLAKPKYAGRVLPRPFVFPTFDEERATVERIMSETWV